MENATVDGNRLLMVAMEMVIALFVLLYNFPHVPTRILKDEGENEMVWSSLSTHASLQVALLRLLQTSPVFAGCLALQGRTPETLTAKELCDPRQLDAALGLALYANDVPVTCQQMYYHLCGVYAAILFPSYTVGNELMANQTWLSSLYLQQGVMEHGAVQGGATAALRQRSAVVTADDQEDLLRFGTTHAVAWLQPYFASHPFFFHPRGRGMRAGCA